MVNNPITQQLEARLAMEGKSVPMRIYVKSADGKMVMWRDTANTRWEVRDGVLCLFDPKYDDAEPKELINPDIIAAVDFGQFDMSGTMVRRTEGGAAQRFS